MMWRLKSSISNANLHQHQSNDFVFTGGKYGN